MEGFIGPALPPHLQRKYPTSVNKNEEPGDTPDSTSENSTFGPSLPLRLKNRLSKGSVEKRSVEGELDVVPLLPHHSNYRSPKYLAICNSEGDPLSGHSLSPVLPMKSSHQLVKQSYKIESDLELALPTHLCNEPSPHTSSDVEFPVGCLSPKSPKHITKKRVSRDEKKDATKVCDLRRESEDDDGSVLVLTADSSDEEFGEQQEDEVYGPVLPPSLKSSSVVLGPKLPPGFKRVGSDTESIVGPTLPPGMLGPTLPPGFKVSDDVTKENTVGLVGELKDRESSESDEDVVGPIPEGSVRSSFIQEQLEIRALQMRRSFAGDGKCDNDGVPKRESWMLELPPERAAEFGLGPRQFRARAKVDPGDRSVWTDTPDDRERKKHCKVEGPVISSEQLKQRAVVDRDIAMEREANRHAHKRGEKSLLDRHQEELKKKRKKDKESGVQLERRPFDRDTDLQTNRFDEAQKKAIFNKARLLNDRFSAGQSKFL